MLIQPQDAKSSKMPAEPCMNCRNTELRLSPSARLGLHQVQQQPQAPLHGAAMQWEMQAEADAVLALVILPTEEKHSLLLPALTRNRLCRARIYRIILITKLKLLISCHPTHGAAGRRWQKAGNEQRLSWQHRTCRS